MKLGRTTPILRIFDEAKAREPGAAMRIETEALEAFQKELAAKRYKYARPQIEDMPWGSRDMSIRDPFGNRLTFTSAISTR
jgi:hypothetical protein